VGEGGVEVGFTAGGRDVIWWVCGGVLGWVEDGGLRDLPAEVVDAFLGRSHLCCCSLEGVDLWFVFEWAEGCSRCM